MKHITTTLWITLLTATFTCLAANEQMSIDQQIAAMQKASPQDRVKLMNQFKQQLASMNAEERSKSISHLREEMKANNNHTEHQPQEDGMHNEAQRDQMQQSEHLQRMEQMQQRHGGDQYMQEMDKEIGEMGSQHPTLPQQH